MAEQAVVQDGEGDEDEDVGSPSRSRDNGRYQTDSSPAPGDGSGMHASSSRRLLLLSEAVTPPDAVRRAPSPSTAARRVHLTQNQLRLSAHPTDQGLSAAMVVVAAERALPSMPEQLKPPAGTRLQIFERELQAKAKEVNASRGDPMGAEKAEIDIKAAVGSLQRTAQAVQGSKRLLEAAFEELLQAAVEYGQGR